MILTEISVKIPTIKLTVACHMPVSSQKKPHKGISTDQEVIWVYAVIYSANK